MKANETTVRNLLQGEKQYVVPLYQRRYSWKRKDLAQVWADVMRVTEVSDNATHFLGSVVLAPSPANTPTGVQSWLVVDGQQRLTTLSILLCAIRDHVQESDAQLQRLKGQGSSYLGGSGSRVMPVLAKKPARRSVCC